MLGNVSDWRYQAMRPGGVACAVYVWRMTKHLLVIEATSSHAQALLVVEATSGRTQVRVVDATSSHTQVLLVAEATSSHTQAFSWTNEAINMQVFRDDGVRSGGEVKLSQSAEGATMPITAAPRLYHLVWRDNGRLPVTMWEPLPPPGYRALGTVVLGALNPNSAAQAVHYPEPDLVLCIREDLCGPARLASAPIWKWDPPALQVRSPSSCLNLLTAPCPDQATPSPLLAACLWPCLLPVGSHHT
jgi:hypothetical protein